MKLVWIASAGDGRWTLHGPTDWMYCPKNVYVHSVCFDARIARIVTVESAREDYGCVVPARGAR